ncbi:hypothetical protein Cgig2_028165 [Carnegiea gigantea]|uniref:Uncharacterized protein n=1 Tax=Carnegiea gigantea TaxID=171969 RepID=A0A9Q1GYJ7_9CARY|nr:hypothetical protein Cgig2_028165 [Carnegiea gigantea]
MKKGIYFFDKKPFIVKAWNEKLSLDISSLQTFPVLEIKYWGVESLSKLASMLGIPIKTDKTTKEKLVLGYARILVEMPVEGPFPEYIDFVNDSDRVVRQFIRYEWKPTRCNHCRMLGHEEANYRKKPNLRQEWRVKEVQAPEANTMVHCKATQMTTQKQFAITFVCGANSITEIQSLCTVLKHIANSAQGPWCVMDDFNAVLSLGDRMGEDVVQHEEIQDFATCLEECELQEVTSNGAYFTWTNKRVWSRIDRVSLVEQFWPAQANTLKEIYTALKRLQSLLKKLNRDKFADLQEQEERVRNNLEQIQLDLQGTPSDAELIVREKEARGKYLQILHSSLSLRRQQNGQGRRVEGFEEVARVFVECYQDLLGEQPIIRDQIDKRVMQIGAILSVEQQMAETTK